MQPLSPQDKDARSFQQRAIAIASASVPRASSFLSEAFSLQRESAAAGRPDLLYPDAAATSFEDTVVAIVACDPTGLGVYSNAIGGAASSKGGSSSVDRGAAPEIPVHSVVGLPTSGSDASDTELEGGGKKRIVDSRTPPQAKLRKTAYALRKEKKALLEKEVKTLQTHVDFLKESGGFTDSQLVEKELNNALLREAVRGQQLSVATAQSAVSGFLNAERTNPMSTCIRLGTDWDERREMLLGMKERKIRNATEYIRARSQFLDPLKPHLSDERFENAQGDFCCVRCDVVQFEGARSVKQVYDAIIYYCMSMEITISERLGHITVREDYDYVERSISNRRLISNEFGVLTETNGVLFFQYFESHELSNGAPCGIITSDFVDEDALNPYIPTARVRKDVTSAVVLTQHMRKKCNGEEGEELVVTMSRSGFLKLRRSDMEIAPHIVQEMRDGIAGWGQIMVRAINAMLHSMQ